MKRSLFATVILALAGCATQPLPPDVHPAAPGISRAEANALRERHGAVLEAEVPSYSDAALKQLFRRSLQPLDGEEAGTYATVLAIALADVGDERFARVLQEMPVAVRRAVARRVEWMWQSAGLDYPRTRAVVRGAGA